EAFALQLLSCPPSTKNPARANPEGDVSAHLHDLSRFAIAVGTAAGITWVGGLLLCLVPRPARSLLLPAAPVVGVCTLVVVFHWTGLLTGTDVAAPSFGGLVLAATVFTLIWRRDRLASSRRAAVLLVAGLALGVPAVLVAMQPTFSVDTGDAIHPSGNHDAFWYASVSTWLEGHRANETPDLGAAPAPQLDPRAFAPMVQARRYGLRIGEPMLHAAATSLTRLDMTKPWYPVQAAWLFLMPGAWI